MSLIEFMKLVRKHWKIVTIIPIVCILIFAAYLYAISVFGESKSAKTSVVVNSQVAIVYGHASSSARQAVDDDSVYEISVKGDTASMTVTISVTGPDEQECLRLADAVATDAVAATEADFVSNEGSPYKTEFRAQIEQATLDNSSSLVGKTKYFLVVFAVGILIALCVIVIIDMRRCVIKSEKMAQEILGVPLLETIPATSGARLLANVCFAAKRTPLSLCVASLGEERLAVETGQLIQHGEYDNMPEIKCCSISDNELRSYSIAKDCEAAVVVVQEFVDSQDALEHAAAEFHLAEVNVVGFVYAK